MGAIARRVETSHVRQGCVESSWAPSGRFSPPGILVLSRIGRRWDQGIYGWNRRSLLCFWYLSLRTHTHTHTHTFVLILWESISPRDTQFATPHVKARPSQRIQLDSSSLRAGFDPLPSIRPAHFLNPSLLSWFGKQSTCQIRSSRSAFAAPKSYSQS